jgi:hypothetical protein
MEKDIWLSRVMSTNCYKFKCDSIYEYLDIRNSVCNSGSFFTTVKTKSMPERLTYGDKNSIHWVSSMNTYIWNTTNYSYSKQNRNIRFYESDNFREISEIASNSFDTDRFHNDPRISKSFADKIKKEWVSSNLKGSRKSITLVYTYPNDTKVVAFNSLLVTKEFLIIDLIAVLNEFRKRGIGAELIQASQKIAADRNLPLVVGTQVKNPANHLYIKNSFKIKEQSFVFHDTDQIFK